MDRRTFLASGAAVAVPLVSGCTGDDGGGTSPTETTTETTETTTETTETTTETTETTTETTETTTTTTETTTTTTTETTRTMSQSMTVKMVMTSFEPLRARIVPGGSVTWTNEDSFEHDVTSARFHDAAEQWDYQKTLAKGESVTRTFESAGIYEYYCTIHGRTTMCGAVLVGDVSLSKNLPCEDEDEDGDGGGYGY